MAIQVRTPGWDIRRTPTSRGATRRGVDTKLTPDLPEAFIPPDARAIESMTLAPKVSRGAAAAPSTLDLESDVGAGETAVLVVRHASGALTFHAPIRATSRAADGLDRVRFVVPIRRRPTATRGLLDSAVKAVVIKLGSAAADKVVSAALPKVVAAIEGREWEKAGLREGWHRVTPATLTSGLEAARPAASERSLLFIHGTFSDAASAFGALATSTFFDNVTSMYGDRIYAFNHFTLSRTPQENAEMLLAGLPPAGVTFDVITHSRGGLVLREIVEHGVQFKGLERRFTLGRAVLVASPNEGTPLATRGRWEETLGLVANLVELLPDNPLTTASAFVSNGLKWLAQHVVGDVPGLAAMDHDGEAIETLQATAGVVNPPRYSALVANYQPSESVALRLFDAGIDQFFAAANDLVVPTAGGWQVGRRRPPAIPADRIGCFGPGGNIDGDDVTHTSFFSREPSVRFLVRTLSDRPLDLRTFDPFSTLPDRRVLGRGSRLPDEPGPPARRERRPQVDHQASATLQVEVVNGNLTYVADPLLLGHYRASRLTGTESVMNTLLGDAMAKALSAGLYPDAVGAHKVFTNRRPNYELGTLPRPQAVIIAGLGEEGRLKGPQLAQTVKLAALAWAQTRYAEDRHGEGAAAPSSGGRGSRARVAHTFELAATLLGSGGTEIGPGESARLIVKGLCDANQTMRDADVPWPRFTHLRLIELYMDRAAEAWRALRLQLDARADDFTLAGTITNGTGGLLRPADASYRGASYDFISVQAARDDRNQTLLSYTLDTRRARSEVRGQRAQSRLLRKLITSASNDRENGVEIRRTLFNLLIPVELEPYLAGTGQMVMELEPQTAGIPWELLDTPLDGDRSGRPWGIRVTVLRKLKVQEFRDRVADADGEADALVIGEPEASSAYPRLPGARLEAAAVAARLAAGLTPDSVTSLIADEAGPGPNARRVLDALFERPWRILHISGHGAPVTRDSNGGVVLSDNTFLDASVIASLRTTPELVFINCCHLAAGDPRAVLDAPAKAGQFDRAAFAASVARALIDIGVRCVVAAGWAVDDDVASVFAESFYGAVLRNAPFIEAVGAARLAAWERSHASNTWAAYQCYGDPDWCLRPTEAGGRNGAGSRPDLTIASLPQLELALAQLAVSIQSSGQAANDAASVASWKERFFDLEKAFLEKWPGCRDGRIAEALGAAAMEVGELEHSVKWYQTAVDAADARASIKAAEQLANARARLAWEHVESAQQAVDAATRAVEDARRRAEAATRAVGRAPGKTRRVSRGASTSDRQARETTARSAVKEHAAAVRALQAAERRLGRLRADGRSGVRASLRLLAQLRNLGDTVERWNLVGSTHKRSALVALTANQTRAFAGEVARMHEAYFQARNLGVHAGKQANYGALNCLLADLVLSIRNPKPHTLDPQMAQLVRAAAIERDADFWNAVGAIELQEYEAIARRRLASAAGAITRRFQDLHTRVSARRAWSSVYDSAFLALTAYRLALVDGSRKGADVATEQESITALLTLLRGYARLGA